MGVQFRGHTHTAFPVLFAETGREGGRNHYQQLILIIKVAYFDHQKLILFIIQLLFVYITDIVSDYVY